LKRPQGESRWITDAAARRHAHQLRASVDAILVGAETVRVDDPRLTVRGLLRARQPWRVVLTRSGHLPQRARLFSDWLAARTLIYKRKSLAMVLRGLGKKGVTSVLIEGGGKLLGEALDARLIDKVQIYLGTVLTGGSVVAFSGRGAGSTADALRLGRVAYQQIGQSVCITAHPKVQTAK
jgi:diaminohydroxyphosphoribosylaminopyrimidine deaminase / 5-amino-6-(5-phosphoribosylamino)uracil reductase